MAQQEHGGTLLARALDEVGIRTLFALPGGHVLPLFDGARQVGLRVIDTRHEENAVLMASGTALATGGVGVAAVTAGPGLTNAVPGMAEANASGVPVVVLAGRTGLAQQGRGAVQDIDQAALVAPISKWRGVCLAPDRIPALVAEALHQARSGAPGVAYLELPQDVLAASAAYAPPPSPAGDGGRPVPPAAEVAEAVRLLTNAERPVVVAGSGAFFSQAADALAQFAARTGIPVVTTSAARGLLPDDGPGCLGSLVHGGVALVSADVSLVLGSRFNANLVYGGPPLFGLEQQVIQVDLRPENLGGPRSPDLALVGDVAGALDALTEAWEAPPERFAGWREDAAGAGAVSRQSWSEEAEAPATGLHPGLLARETARFAAEQGLHTFVSDGGDSVVWGLAFSAATGPGRNLFIGSALGTLGVGTPYAVAAKVARPDEPVFLFTGDGAFGMSAMELDTAQRYGSPLVVVVVNNGGWGDVRHEQAAAYGGSGEVGEASGMRYDLLAAAVGGHGERIGRPEEIRPALDRALAANQDGRVALIDAHTDPDVVSSFMANMGGLGLM